MLSLLKKLISALADGCELYAEMVELSGLPPGGSMGGASLSEYLFLPPPVCPPPWFAGNYPISSRRNTAHFLLALPYAERQDQAAWGGTDAPAYAD